MTSSIRTFLRRSVLIVSVAAAAVGLTATSASALNPRTYNQLQNANSHRYCMDMKSEDRPEGARAQLWNCTHVSEQQFILVGASGPVLGLETIRSKSAGKCLVVNNPAAGSAVSQHACYSGPVPNPGGSFTQAENWDLRTTGEIVNELTGMCLTPTSDSKGAFLKVQPCDGTIAQRWFF